MISLKEKFIEDLQPEVNHFDGFLPNSLELEHHMWLLSSVDWKDMANRVWFLCTQFVVLITDEKVKIDPTLVNGFRKINEANVDHEDEIQNIFDQIPEDSGGRLTARFIQEIVSKIWKSHIFNLQYKIEIFTRITMSILVPYPKARGKKISEICLNSATFGTKGYDGLIADCIREMSVIIPPRILEPFMRLVKQEEKVKDLTSSEISFEKLFKSITEPNEQNSREIKNILGTDTLLRRIVIEVFKTKGEDGEPTKPFVRLDISINIFLLFTPSVNKYRARQLHILLMDALGMIDKMDPSHPAYFRMLAAGFLGLIGRLKTKPQIESHEIYNLWKGHSPLA